MVPLKFLCYFITALNFFNMFQDTIPEVKDAYVNFLTHCYIDTEVEMKEIYTSHHMWQLFERYTILLSINTYYEEAITLL